jgi:hypothetical protein
MKSDSKVFVYKNPQNVIGGSVFVMGETYDKGFERYVIPYYSSEGINHFEITHARLTEALEKKEVVRLVKHNFARGKEFIRIPLYVK